MHAPSRWATSTRRLQFTVIRLGKIWAPHPLWETLMTLFRTQPFFKFSTTISEVFVLALVHCASRRGSSCPALHKSHSLIFITSIYPKPQYCNPALILSSPICLLPSFRNLCHAARGIYRWSDTITLFVFHLGSLPAHGFRVLIGV